MMTFEHEIIKSDENDNEIDKGIDEKNWDKVKEMFSGTDLLQLGNYYSWLINFDIKHVAFSLSRYKFASKMLKYKQKVKLLELGCSEAFGAMLLKQNINLEQYIGIDLDRDAIDWNKKYLSDEFEFICSNFFDCIELEKEAFDAVVSLDVIEHILPEREDEFCHLIVSHIKKDGVVIIGTPNITMQSFASEAGRRTHINLYDQKRLYAQMSKYFQNVFIFNMNDEIVSTGFEPMACYIFALCCNKK